MKFLELNKYVMVYYLGDDWYCDIVRDYSSNYYECWLYHNSIGVKVLMFGSTCFLDAEFIKLVRHNLENESYIDDYREEYML